MVCTIPAAFLFAFFIKNKNHLCTSCKNGYYFLTASIDVDALMCYNDTP